MSYKPKFLGHVNLFVRNAERSQQWYEDILACTPMTSSQGGRLSCRQTLSSPTK